MSVNLKEDIRPISYIKANAADVMNYVNDRKNPIVITQNGEARAVLIDIESYQTMQNAFTLLSIFKIAEDEYHSGAKESLNEVVNKIEKEYFSE
jgi:prevent-host-death family protein